MTVSLATVDNEDTLISRAIKLWYRKKDVISHLFPHLHRVYKLTDELCFAMSSSVIIGDFVTKLTVDIMMKFYPL